MFARERFAERARLRPSAHWWPKTVEIGVPTVLLIVAAFSYAAWIGWNAWWRWDDPKILMQATLFSPWQYFTDPDAWRTLSRAHLTPWVTASFDLDLITFGLSPRGFYLHQAMSLSVVTVMLYRVARLWYPREVALLSPAVFMLSPTTYVYASQLMTRHYVEGLAFALIACYLFVLALRRDRLWLSLLAAAFYALACSAKEVYVPLVGLLLFLPESTLGRRMNLLLPMLVVACLYVIWRLHMLGLAVGSYATQQGLDVLLQKAVLMPLTALQYLFGPVWAYLFLLLAAVAIGVAARRVGALFIGCAAVCVAVPLLPLAGILSPQESSPHTARYLIVVVTILALMAPLLPYRCPGRLGRGAALVVALALFSVPLLARTLEVRDALAPEIARLEKHGRFVVSHQLPGCLWVALQLHHPYIVGLQELLPSSHLRVLTDEIELDAGLCDGVRIWGWSEACACITELTDRAGQRLASWRDRVDAHAALSVRIDTDPTGRIAWELGPYTAGRYSAIDSRSIGKLHVPRAGQARATPEQLMLRFRYDAPSGWITYSEPLDARLSPGGRIKWLRRGPSLP